MDPFRSKATGSHFDAATATTAAAVVTWSSTTKARHVTHIAGSCDQAGAVTLAWTHNGTAKTWKMRFAAAFQFAIVFPPGAIHCDAGSNIVLTVPAGTANTEANLGGDFL